MSEIQEAIEFYKSQNENMERETWNPEKVCPAYKKNKLAIAALQEQAEHEKGCEYCLHGKHFETDSTDRDDVLLNGNCIEVGISVSDSYGETEIKINFCPVCGRDLRKPVEK